MGAVVSPSGAGCEHVDIFDDATGEKLGTITRQEYGEIVGLSDGWDPEHATTRATLDTQVHNAITRLKQIENGQTPTNAQVLAAIRDLAKYLRHTVVLTVATDLLGDEDATST